MAMSNAEGYKKEIAVLRDKLQKYTASVAKHEQTINSQRQVSLSLKIYPRSVKFEEVIIGTAYFLSSLKQA